MILLIFFDRLAAWVNRIGRGANSTRLALRALSQLAASFVNDPPFTLIGIAVTSAYLLPRNIQISAKKPCAEIKMKNLLAVVYFLMIGFSLSGCVLVAAAGAGYLVGDEVTEGDGKFDPLEKVRNKENGAN